MNFSLNPVKLSRLAEIIFSYITFKKPIIFLTILNTNFSPHRYELITTPCHIKITFLIQILHHLLLHNQLKMTTLLLIMKICLTSLQTIMYLAILTILTMIVPTMMICKITFFICPIRKSHNLNPQLHFNFFPRVADSSHTFFLNPLVVIVYQLFVAVIVHPTISAITLTQFIIKLKHVLTFP